MNEPTNRSLYDLLPAFVRARDAQATGALRAVLTVMDGELAAVEADVRRWYENWFIETCEPWVAAYIGDLVDVRSIHPIDDQGGRPRAYVANAIRNRRRKGTLAGLEQACRDVSGWPVRAVEMFPRIVTAADVRYARGLRTATPDMRDGSLLDRIGTAFDDVPRSIDVRSIARGRGLHGLPNIALFVFRRASTPIRRQRASLVDDYDLENTSGLFRFDLFGRDRALLGVRRPLGSGELARYEHALPSPIRRRALHDDLERHRARVASSPGAPGRPDYLPDERPSFEIFLDDATEAFPAERIVVADLSRWQRPPAAEDDASWTLAIDPELGRIAAPIDRVIEDAYVSYHVPCVGLVGGGYDPRNAPSAPDDEHARLATRATALGFDAPYAKRYAIRRAPGSSGGADATFSSLVLALAHAQAASEGSVLFQIEDSDRYLVGVDELEAPAELVVPPFARWAIRAANDDLARGASLIGNDWPVRLGEGARLDIGGVAYRGSGPIRLLGVETDTAIRFEDCTLTPNVDPESSSYGASSVTVGSEASTVEILVRRCITGPLMVYADDTKLVVEDSILDGTRDGFAAFAMRASFSRVTAFAQVVASRLDVASNSLFARGFVSCRSSRTCVRFCYLGDPSLAVSAHRCEPDATLARLPESEHADARARLVPTFVSRTFGAPGYGQLSPRCPEAIRRGADDGGEIGVFNLTRTTQREDNLRVALGEQLRFGLEAGFVFVS